MSNQVIKYTPVYNDGDVELLIRGEIVDGLYVANIEKYGEDIQLWQSWCSSDADPKPNGKMVDYLAVLAKNKGIKRAVIKGYAQLSGNMYVQYHLYSCTEGDNPKVNYDTNLNSRKCAINNLRKSDNHESVAENRGDTLTSIMTQYGDVLQLEQQLKLEL